MLRRSSLAMLLCLTSVRAEIRPAALDRIVEATRKAWDVPGLAVAIVHGNDTVYIKGFGVKRSGSTDRVTPDTRFAICSATKPFTTTAMAILVDEGKMSWDDPVRKHLPYFKLSDTLADANVTMRDLVCHRTGLASHDWLWNNPSGSREEVVRRIGFLPLSQPFRSVWNYQNIMFVAAGEAVGRIAGTTWEDFVARRLFAPLGMTHSDFGVKDPATSPDVVTPHTHLAQKLQPVEWYNLEKVGPAGSINSTVRDLTRWMRLHLNEGEFEGRVIVKQAMIHETHTPQMLLRFSRSAMNEGTNLQAYGLGWFVSDYRGHLVIDHPGLIEGFSSTVLLMPDDRYGVAILSNLGENIPEISGVLKRAIMDELLGLPVIERSAAVLEARRQAEENANKQREARASKQRRDTTPSHAVADYAGVYEDPAYGTVRINVDAGHLTLDWNNWHASLEHYQFDTFRTTGNRRLADTLVQFRLYPRGDVESLRMLGREFYRKR